MISRPRGYVTYCGEAFATFNADREAIARAIVAAHRSNAVTSNIDIEQRLGLPQFEVNVVFTSLAEQRLITVLELAAGRLLMQVMDVSPVLEEGYL